MSLLAFVVDTTLLSLLVKITPPAYLRTAVAAVY